MDSSSVGKRSPVTRSPSRNRVLDLLDRVEGPADAQHLLTGEPAVEGLSWARNASLGWVPDRLGSVPRPGPCLRWAAAAL